MAGSRKKKHRKTSELNERKKTHTSSERKKKRIENELKRFLRVCFLFVFFFVLLFFVVFVALANSIVVVHETTHGTRRAPPETHRAHERYERVEAVIETDSWWNVQPNVQCACATLCASVSVCVDMVVWLSNKFANGFGRLSTPTTRSIHTRFTCTHVLWIHC